MVKRKIGVAVAGVFQMTYCGRIRNIPSHSFTHLLERVANSIPYVYCSVTVISKYTQPMSASVTDIACVLVEM